jgi:fructose-specific phosphotransferase system IIC component
MGGHLSRARQYRLTGVSYAIRFVAAGGVLIAAGEKEAGVVILSTPGS